MSKEKIGSLVQFLKENNVFEEFESNRKVKNQRWNNPELYIVPSDVCKNYDPEQWLDRSFHFLNRPKMDTGISWYDVNIEWGSYIKDHPDGIFWEYTKPAEPKYYTGLVKETNKVYVTVEAKSAADAQQILEDRYIDGDDYVESHECDSETTVEIIKQGE